MIKFALVGCGRILKRLSEVLGENETDGAQFVAVCDKIISNTGVIAEKYSIPAWPFACMK